MAAKKLTISLPDHLVTALRRAAVETGQPVSGVAAAGISQYLIRLDAERVARSRWRSSAEFSELLADLEAGV